MHLNIFGDRINIESAYTSIVDRQRAHTSQLVGSHSTLQPIYTAYKTIVTNNIKICKNDYTMN